MTIKRAAPGNNPFTIILNEVITDSRLGADTLGVLVYLISKPPTWEVKIKDLREQFNIGRDKAYKLLSHLVDLGYAERYQGRDDTGGFSDNNYLIFDRINRLPENTEAVPLPEMPYTANQAPIKKERKQTKDSPYSEEFEAIWKQYPRTKNTPKWKAWDLYRMLNDERRQLVRIAVPLFAAAMRAENRPEDKILHMTTWLNGRTYETASAPAGSPGAAPAKTYRDATRDDWQKILNVWASTSDWRQTWGPEPGKPGCAVPDDMVAAHNVKHRGYMFSDEQLESFRSQVRDAENVGSAVE